MFIIVGVWSRGRTRWPLCNIKAAVSANIRTNHVMDHQFKESDVFYWKNPSEKTVIISCCLIFCWGEINFCCLVWILIPWWRWFGCIKKRWSIWIRLVFYRDFFSFLWTLKPTWLLRHCLHILCLKHRLVHQSDAWMSWAERKRQKPVREKDIQICECS